MKGERVLLFGEMPRPYNNEVNNVNRPLNVNKARSLLY